MEPLLRLLEANKNLKVVATDLPHFRQESFAGPLVQRAYEDVQSSTTRAKVGDSLKQLDELPRDYFSKEMRATLEITRALWLRDVKLDTEAAISSLRRVAEMGNNRGQYFLAQTFYQRARKAREAEAKQDYEMVATLLPKVKDERFPDFFEVLRVTNHKLGKDKTTRDFLRGELEKSPNSAINLAEQLYFVCVNYMNDLECADKALPEIGAGVHSLRAYDIGLPYAAELAVLRGNYSGVQPSAIATMYTPQEVIYFYLMWTNSATGDEREAQVAANKWLDEMKTARTDDVKGINFLSCDSASCWVFDAAKRALNADQRLKPDRKELLSLMIAAMEDKAQLPSLSKYFPAASVR
jgi:TPR repeat protein